MVSTHKQHLLRSRTTFLENVSQATKPVPISTKNLGPILAIDPHHTRSPTDSISNMPLPIRNAFFETGLVPVSDPASKTGSPDCPICAEPLTDAVTLPCHETHIYCKECITQWLTAPDTCTCPNCRTQLFDPSVVEEIVRAPLELADYLPHPDQREQLAEDALRVSGITVSASPRRYTNTTLDVFGRRAMPHGHIIEGGQAARNYIRIFCGLNGMSEQEIRYYFGIINTIVTGEARIHSDSLIPRIVAMAHLIPAMAEIQQRPFSAEERQTWRPIVSSLAEVISGRSGRPYDVVAMFPILCHLVVSNFEAQPANSSLDFSPFSPWETEGVRSEDFKFLLCFVAHEAWEHEQERLRETETEALFRRHREMVRLYTSSEVSAEMAGCPQQ